jgi:membrane protease YdiL (CAAX protease family)
MPPIKSTWFRAAVLVALVAVAWVISARIKVPLPHPLFVNPDLHFVLSLVGIALAASVLTTICIYRFALKRAQPRFVTIGLWAVIALTLVNTFVVGI